MLGFMNTIKNSIGPLHKKKSTMAKLATLAVFLCLAVHTPATSFASGQSSAQLNLDDNGTALQGYDPVSYHLGNPEPGKTELSWEYDGAVYFFASADNLQTFKTDPERYVPALGGWCAWAMLDGEKVKIDPKTYKVIDGTTYLFYNFFFVNTLSKWNKLAEQETEGALVEKARAAWEKMASR